MIIPLRYANPTPRLIYTNPTEAIILSIKIAIVCGIILAIPVVFYQIWRFVSPGLYKNEKVLVLPLVIASTIFFLLGVSFSYVTVPFVISFLARFAEGKMDAFYKAQEYLGFLIKLGLAFGIVFELPVVSYILTRAGLIGPSFLIKNFKYALIMIFILAALLTPPDIISQMLLAAPLLLLYGVSILVSFFVREKKSD
jgi:sec-independent protein translocase protein TatC